MKCFSAVRGSDKLIASDGSLSNYFPSLCYSLQMKRTPCTFVTLSSPWARKAFYRVALNAALLLLLLLQSSASAYSRHNTVHTYTLQDEWNEKERGRIRRRSIIMWESFNYDNLRPACTINHRRAKPKNSLVPALLCFFSHIGETCTL